MLFTENEANSSRLIPDRAIWRDFAGRPSFSVPASLRLVGAGQKNGHFRRYLLETEKAFAG